MEVFGFEIRVVVILESYLPSLRHFPAGIIFPKHVMQKQTVGLVIQEVAVLVLAESASLVDDERMRIARVELAFIFTENVLHGPARCSVQRSSFCQRAKVQVVPIHCLHRDL